ncbi:PsbP-like protein 1, chloroplastic [Apostasia shenzhenica]|uniref:PsbP-like protein 1, chloroplastic n=1 Tax=Apostasia shenzhenica TaxID=1088818 RepID=A0A2I0B7G5_9ASPA|nr:PsbP-like protein 1, chloroplastic [Apostasia shenzhenica]
MAALQNSPALQKRLLLSATSSSSNKVALQGPACFPGFYYRRRNFPPQTRAEASPSTQQACFLERSGRRQAVVLGVIAPCLSLSQANSASFAAEAIKGFLAVSDKKDGYSFVYPFGWQEVIVQGQDKVFKDVIEPLESVSINTIPTSKQDIRELGPPQEVANALIRKVLAPPSQKVKLVEALERDVDGKAYYTFEFTAQAPNFTRHALGAITIGNGKFYTLTTGANERRWEKMKDKLHTVVESFKISAA